MPSMVELVGCVLVPDECWVRSGNFCWGAVIEEAVKSKESRKEIEEEVESRRGKGGEGKEERERGERIGKSASEGVPDEAFS